MKRIAVIGAGPAGIEAALSARKAGAEAVALFSREAALPYGRPALPAAAFSGLDIAKAALHPEEWYGRNGIELRLDTPVTGIDLENHLLKTLDGEELFDAFVLAGGANPLKPIIPGLMASPSLYTLWSAEDARKIAAHCRRGRLVAIVGGGLIGVESALRAAKAGKKPILIEKGPRLLRPLLDEPAEKILRRQLADAGVAVMTGASIVGATQIASKLCLKIEGAKATLDVDMVVLAVGSKANLSLAQSAGLSTDKGICVDETLQTSAPDVYAAGDCIQFGTVTRSSVMAAIEQGRIAGRNAAIASDVVEPSIYAMRQYPTRMACEGVTVCAWGQTAEQNAYATLAKVTGGKPPSGSGRFKVVRQDGIVAGVQMVGTDIGFNELLPNE
ncbi:MAG: FAD-dependent oxidoreductase [Kiritimatiellae bacterium]|nr:FAD-dependent oxidoreductase [Kiritimatiellia bacterium]